MSKAILSILTLVLISSIAIASEMQSHELLLDKIKDHVVNELADYSKEAKVHVSTGKIDSRLTLPACADDQLQVFNPYKSAMIQTTTMGIKCKEATNHWTIYVPIDISLIKTVIAAKNPIRRGSRINQDDLYEAEMDVQQLKQGYFKENKKVIGLIAKHNIKEGAAITPYNLQLPKLVLKGERVSIVAKGESFKISMDGVAMEEGTLGESVRVKNLSSQRIIEASVASRKVVEIIL